MQYAIEQGYQHVLNMDADFSHPPALFAGLAGGHGPPGGPPVDVMIGSRYIPGGGVEGWPLKRHFMSRGINLYARWLLGLKPKDCSGALSLLPHRNCWRKLDFEAIRRRGYSFQEEILWRLETRWGPVSAKRPSCSSTAARAVPRSTCGKPGPCCGSS